MIRNLSRSLADLTASKRGVTAVEYALIGAVFMITAVGGFTTLGANISSVLGTVGNDLVSAASSASSSISGSGGSTSAGSTTSTGSPTQGSGEGDNTDHEDN